MKYWVWLAELRGVSTRRKIELLKQFGSADMIYEQDASGYAAVGISPREIQALEQKSLENAEKILERCDQKGIRILTYGDRRYPSACVRLSSRRCCSIIKENCQTLMHCP